MHSGITKERAESLGIALLETAYSIDGKEVTEGNSIPREEVLERMRAGAAVATSQPSPAQVMDLWDRELASADQLVYIPISSGLSGSCQSAMMLAQEDTYKGRVFVVDNGRVSTPQSCTVLDALEMVKKGYSAEKIKRVLEELREQVGIYLAVDNLDYLRRGGRITGAVAVVGKLINIKPIVRFGTGKIEEFQNCRGMKKARKTMIEAVKNDLKSKVKDWYEKGAFHLLAASSATPEVTAEWVKEIEEAFPGIPVLWDYLPLAVTCHTGPDSLGIGYSCREIEEN
jgi:DegV family protein with EDD domain